MARDLFIICVAGTRERLHFAAMTAAVASVSGRGVRVFVSMNALAGQTVCRRGDIVSVDGKILALAQDRDRLGRPLPVWQGCHRLGPNEVFLMNPACPDSLDGRYFGPLPVSTVIGRATPLWLPKKP